MSLLLSIFAGGLAFLLVGCYFDRKKNRTSWPRGQQEADDFAMVFIFISILLTLALIDCI